MDQLKLAGRYEIMRELGRGGVGIVYLARDPVLDRMVAIKTLRPQKLDAESQIRFDREARAIAKMDHPGIVQIFDIGSTEGGTFFVMSYVEGKSLRELMGAGELQVHEVLELGAQVAEALDYSHSKGIVHRDIKPENIMVFEKNGKRQAKLMDFGISLANKDTRLTDANSIFGTLVYLPPESVLGHAVGPGSDIYSLGAVLYETLAGRLPFDGDPNIVLMKIVNGEPKSLRSLNPKVDALTEALILNCLSKASQARPESAQGLAKALHEHAAELRGERHAGSADRPSVRRALVGRKEAWADLTTSFQRALTGATQLTLIEGDTGQGKSTLLSELTLFVKSRGATVLSGKFVERRDPSSPFQAFGEAIGEFVRGTGLHSGLRPAEVVGNLMPRLLRLFPLLADPSATPDSSRAADTAPPSGAEAIDLVAHTVARIADATPLVLLLEDLHLADISLQALHQIYRRRPAARLHLVGTYTLGEMESDHPLHTLLKTLAGEQRVIRITLGSLSEAETGELVGQLAGFQVPAPIVRAVQAVTGGNPLFVVEVVNSLVEADQLNDAAVSGIKTPESLRRLSEDRIARLSEADRGVLTTAAVLGTVFASDLLCEFDGSDGVEDRIDSLIARRIFREEVEAGQGRVAFSSPLLRDALYRSIPPLRRRGLHRRAADLIRARSAKRPQNAAAQLYEHLMGANDPTAAAPFAVSAARTALAAGSYEAAFRLARSAVEATQDEGYLGDASTAGEAMLLRTRSSEALAEVSVALDRIRSAGDEFAAVDLGSRQPAVLNAAAESAIAQVGLDQARATAALHLREARAAGKAVLERVFTQSLTRADTSHEDPIEIATGAIPIVRRSAHLPPGSEPPAAEDQ